MENEDKCKCADCEGEINKNTAAQDEGDFVCPQCLKLREEEYSETNILELLKKNREESISYFSNINKAEREKWVLKKFLTYMVDVFDESEIKTSNQEPADVIYKDIGFQVKEILSENRKRTKEYKESSNEISDTTKLEDLCKSYRPLHISFNERASRLLSELKRHREKYIKTSDMNVLVYLNLNDTAYKETPVDLSLFEDEVSSWKSVSVVTNNCAVVLHCSDPSFRVLKFEVGVLKFKSNP